MKVIKTDLISCHCPTDRMPEVVVAKTEAGKRSNSRRDFPHGDTASPKSPNSGWNRIQKFRLSIVGGEDRPRSSWGRRVWKDYEVEAVTHDQLTPSSNLKKINRKCDV